MIDYAFASGLPTFETWVVIGVGVLAVFGAWFLISEALDALNEWLNVRELRANEERRMKAVTAWKARTR